VRFLRVLPPCCSALSELLSGIADSMGKLAEPEWTPEEKGLVADAAEFKGYLRAIKVLRRLLWRLGQAGELLLPGASAEVDAAELSEEEAASLRQLQDRAATSLQEARHLWDKVETLLQRLQIEFRPWEPNDSFEAGGCGGKAEQQRNSAPLCRLCLLPARPPFSMESDEEDGGVASALWHGGLWHVQCANFWAKHVTASAESGADPFAERPP